MSYLIASSCPFCMQILWGWRDYAMKKAISLFLALVVLVSVFVGLGITAYAVDTQTLWVDPVNGSDSAAGTQVAPFQTIEKAKAAAAALSAGGDVTVQEVVSSASIR